MPVPNFSFLHQEKSGSVIIDVHVLPNAKRTQLDGLHDGALRVRLQAVPVDGKANDALVDFIAEQLRLKRNQLNVVRGHTSRRKQLRLSAQVVALAQWGAFFSADSCPAGEAD